jgi:hypothetical protein
MKGTPTDEARDMIKLVYGQDDPQCEI